MTYSRSFGLLVALAMALGLLALVGPPASAATTWQPSTAVSGSKDEIRIVQSVMSADGQSVMAIWSGVNDQGDYFLQLARSSDAGVTWGAAQDLYRGTEPVNSPQIVASADGQKVVVAWGGEYSGDQAVMTRVSSDAGATWSNQRPAKLITTTFFTFDLAMSSDGDAVAIAVGEVSLVSSSPLGTVFFVTSSDAGQNWSNAAQLSDPGVYAQSPQIVSSASGQDLVVLWSESTNNGSQIVLRRSPDAGASWTQPKIFQGTLSFNRDPRATLSSDGTTMYVFWSNFDYAVGRQVVVASTRDAGSTWTANTQFEQVEAVSAASVVASSDGSRATAIWESVETGDVALIRSTSTTDAGTTWSAPKSMTPDDAPGFSPRVAASADGTKVTAVWHTGSGRGAPAKVRAALTSAVLATSSTDSGINWEPATTLSETAKLAEYPTIVVSDDSTSLASVWLVGDATDLTGGTRDGVTPSQVRAAVGSTPTPAPTPTPTPTPSPTPAPEKRAQKPAGAKGQPPARIARDGVTVITGRNARTNAGQLIRTRVRCVPVKSVAAGETRYCTVNRGPKGKVTLRTYGQRVRVIVVQVATPTSEYKAYRKRTVYVDGRKR